jgi:hypothetical protein
MCHGSGGMSSMYAFHVTEFNTRIFGSFLVFELEILSLFDFRSYTALPATTTPPHSAHSHPLYASSRTHKAKDDSQRSPDTSQ